MSLTNLLNLIERIGNLLRSEERRLLKPLELLPIHLDILHYLSVCNKYSNNAGALTRYLGNTKGTTSQSVNVLEEKGYVLKKESGNDKRVVNLYLTEKAFSLLEKLSSESSQKILDTESVEVAEGVLRNILRSIQASNKNRTFGVCKTCNFFIAEGQGSLMCGLTREKLLEYETEQICQEHELASYVI
jgi:DNA-binding MarR family transcriptional regulator